MTDPIDVLRKAFQQVISTSSVVNPWDEPLSRSPGLQGADPVQGSLGGWVSSGGYPDQSVIDVAGPGRNPSTGLFAPVRELKEISLGLPGYNDVDYVPYQWGTNRFGSKGGALLGHPISWEVVGPTMKSPYTHWQWTVGFNSVGVSDTLTLVAGPLSTALGASSLPTVVQAYRLDGSGIAAYNAAGGLYAIVSFAGTYHSGSVNSPGTAVTDVSDCYLTNPYEIFRVSGYTGQVLSLNANKKLASYFSGGGTPTIRSITLIRPKLARMLGIPLAQAGAQANRVFLFMPPTRASNSEYMPPYQAGGTCPSWDAGGFNSPSAPGETGDYGTPSRLPIPIPRAVFTALLDSTATGLANTWKLTSATFTSTVVPTAGQIVRVYAHNLNTATNPLGVHGCFEIASVTGTGPYTLTLKRVPEIQSRYGTVYFGNGPYSSGSSDTVRGELLDNVESLFTSSTVNLQKAAATRIVNLIPPGAAKASNKTQANVSFSGVVPSTGKPDRAIFDTRATATNPGNLMDLGFRAVFFPAKEVSSGNIGPDFDHPIDTNDVVLDPTITDERQYLEVDYEGGVLYLSHTPRPGSGCSVAPNGIIVDPTLNPRKEIVLYAACIPYSREYQQVHGTTRVMVTDPDAPLLGFGDTDLTDPYAGRSVFFPDAGVITPGSDVTFTGTSLSSSDVPASGFFMLRDIDPETGVISAGAGPFMYPYFDASGTGTLTKVAFPLGTTTYTITTNTRLVMMKDGTRTTTSFSTTDSSRGSSQRFSTIALKNCFYNIGEDGTIIVEPRISAVDSLDNFLGLEYLYKGGSKTVSMNLDMTSFNPAIGSTTPAWNLEVGIPTSISPFSWVNSVVARQLMIPIPMPSTSTRENVNGVLTHQAVLTTIEVVGLFYGSAPGNQLYLALGIQNNNFSTPSSGVTYAHLNGANKYVAPINAGPLQVLTLTVTNSSGNPLVIDRTSQCLFLQVVANNDAGTDRDQVRGVRITWEDPGPRNF